MFAPSKPVHDSSGGAMTRRIPFSSRSTLRTWVLMLAAVVAVAVTASLALAAKPHPVKGASYSGSTTEHTPVTFMVSASGKAIKHFASALGYNGACGQGGGPGYQFNDASLTIKAKGKFTGTVRGHIVNVH